MHFPEMPVDSNSASHLQQRLSDIERLLGSDPERAEAMAADVLAEVPGHAMARLFQGIGRRLCGRFAEAAEVLRPLCEEIRDAPLPHLQLGLALRETGELDAAARAMRHAVAVKPDFADAWLALAHLFAANGDAEALEGAYRGYIVHAMQNPRLREAAAALNENRAADAEQILRRQLDAHPKDVVALRMLAKVAVQARRFDNAAALLKTCLELAPAYRAARHDYASVLVRQTRPREALDEVEHLLADEPADVGLRKRRAAILQHLLDYGKAAEVYEELLRGQPEDAGLWSSLGHCLRTMGRQERSIEAYRRAIAVAPHSGEAYWNLANLKTYRVTDGELEAMQAQLENPELERKNRIHLHFALGKALEDREQFDRSFQSYGQGNRLRCQDVGWDADRFSAYVDRCMQLFTSAFFAERSQAGADAPDPIFIIGLPRSGSTLVEQILASHSAVEGTMELPQIGVLSASLAQRFAGGLDYPHGLAELAQDEWRELGAWYIERTRVYRKLDKPFFIDKTPNNFEQLGLIALMLPRARVVDVRRHPMACGWSVFSHLFARGQHFSYSQDDIGRYYSDYLRLMEHFDTVLPGRIHRVSYEALVGDLEGETRRLLDYCGLPFEASCLRFHENTRAVSTPSSEQVRAPLFTRGLDQWRRYEAWLGPLKQALAKARG